MNQCIFVFRFRLDEKHARVIEVLGEFNRQFQIEKISSVFKKTNPNVTRLAEEMSFAILARTKIGIENILTEKSKLNGRDYTLELVAFNSEIQWTPDLTLPAPSLNFDPLVLHCCAEVAAGYIHPILKEELRKLDINSLKTDFEFLFQGKIYIDQLA